MRIRKLLNLYRRIAVFATLSILFALSLAAGSAQSQRKKNIGPRAIAVVQWQADGKGLAVPRLLPVAILYDGKFYDASLYRAAPIPMALETETVYEAQDKGELLGYFTVKTGLRAATEDRNWIGIGAWKSASPKADTDFSKLNSRQSAEVVRGITAPTMDTDPADSDDRDLKRKKTTVYDENGKEIPADGKGKDSKDDNRPTLKRPQQDEKPDATGGEQKPSKGSGGDDPDRPTMKRGGDASTQSSSGQNPKDAKPKDDKSSAGKADDDPDRPRIKRGVPTGGSTVNTTVDKSRAARMQDGDPNRPILRHGKPVSRIEEEQQSVARPVPERVLQRGSSAPIMHARVRSEGGTLLPNMRTYEVVAVSDASAKEPDGFRFKWTDDEKRELTAKMSALAQKEVDAFLKSIGRSAVAGTVTPAVPAKGARPTKAGQAMAKPSALLFSGEQSQVTALDLSHNNSPILVFSGRERLQSQTGADQVFVTVVARVDLEGNPRKLFANLTTSDRLDAKPWLEFIDAVDADSDGKGELLFRRIRDVGSEFAIYHVGIEDVVEMFHGSSGE